jgi:rubredoxin
MAPRFPCPCCGYLTLEREPPGTFDLCPVCDWEDDPIQFADPTCEGGANQESLNAARENFRRLGASSANAVANVRPPTDAERP